MTVRVQGRSWKRGWCIVSDASGFRGASPVPRAGGFFTSRVLLSHVAATSHCKSTSWV